MNKREQTLVTICNYSHAEKNKYTKRKVLAFYLLVTYLDKQTFHL